MGTSEEIVTESQQRLIRILGFELDLPEGSEFVHASYSTILFSVPMEREAAVAYLVEAMTNNGFMIAPEAGAGAGEIYYFTAANRRVFMRVNPTLIEIVDATGFTDAEFKAAVDDMMEIPPVEGGASIEVGTLARTWNEEATTEEIKSFLAGVGSLFDEAMRPYGLVRDAATTMPEMGYYTYLSESLLLSIFVFPTEWGRSEEFGNGLGYMMDLTRIQWQETP
jgi:hypothetical protein